MKLPLILICRFQLGSLRLILSDENNIQSPFKRLNNIIFKGDFKRTQNCIDCNL